MKRSVVPREKGEFRTVFDVVDNRIKAARIAKPKCPDCDKELWLMRIVPAQTFEVCLFQCSGCMYEREDKFDLVTAS